MILLYYYTRGWLFKFGKFPYCLFAIPYAVLGIFLATSVYMVCSVFEKPPPPKGWLVRPAHLFMRGEIKAIFNKDR